MRDCVVIKWGGSLITDKENMCTANFDTIVNLSKVVKDCIGSQIDVILVHGAGSFGHLRAKYWRLNEGLLPQELFSRQEDCNNQLQAISITRNEMLTLNKYVTDALKDAGLEVRVCSPHLWARNTGSDFDGAIGEIFSNYHNTVHVTYGDVVECEGKQKFGILSGDDLVVRLCKEIPNVKRLVFAIGGADGILKQPPDVASKGDLIETWSSDMKFIGLHNSKIDVTGGIGLKAIRGAEVAKLGIEVIIVNGAHSERVLAACKGEKTLGTKIVA